MTTVREATPERPPATERPSGTPEAPRPGTALLANRFVPALALFGAVKTVGFAVFMLLLETSKFRTLNPRFGGGTDPWDVLGSWDGWWYQQVARVGYDPQLIPDHGFFTVKQNSSAFFPLYPGLMRLVSDATGIGLYGAGVLISVLSSFAAAAGIYAVTARVSNHRAGAVAAALWAAFPGSGVTWAVYTESLFVALTAWACYFTITRQWTNAALVTFIAGLARPSAATLIGAVALAALVALYQRKDGVLGPLTAIVVPPVGFLGYLGWVGYRMGHLDGYITLQRGAWLHFFDWGAYTSKAVTNVLHGERDYLFTYPTEDLVALLVLFALPCLLIPLLTSRPPVVLSAYTLATLVLVLGSQQMFGTLSRFVLPLFPLAIPAAKALARLRLSSLAAVLTTLAVASGWYAGYVIFELGIP